MIIVGVKPSNNILSWGIRLASKILRGRDAIATHIILIIPEVSLVAEWIPSQSHLFYMEPNHCIEFLNELHDDGEVAWTIHYSQSFKFDSQFASSNLETAPLWHYVLTFLKTLLNFPTPLTDTDSTVRPVYCTDIASLLFSEDYFLPGDRPLFPDEILERAWEHPELFDCTFHLVHSSELTNNFLYK